MEVTPDDELVGKRKARFLDAFWRQLHTFAVPVLNTFGSVGKTKDDEPAGLLTKTDAALGLDMYGKLPYTHDRGAIWLL
jgi:hypothetical protein